MWNTSINLARIMNERPAGLLDDNELREYSDMLLFDTARVVHGTEEDATHHHKFTHNTTCPVLKHLPYMVRAFILLPQATGTERT